MNVPPKPAATRWRSTDSRNFRWYVDGDDFVLYHRPSGKTHFLNAAAHAILTSDPGAMLGTGEIEAALAGAAVAEEIDAMLQRFEELGLLKAVPHDDA